LSANNRGATLATEATHNVAVALALVTSIFLTVTLPVAALPERHWFVTWLIRAVCDLMGLEISVRLTESLLALWWHQPSSPPESQTGNSTRVAVLMTICNDASLPHIARLVELIDAGYDVFILDDSTIPVVIPEDIARRSRVTRRLARTGAKAGNLNHWLAKWSGEYDFCCVLDSDSWVPASALHTLVNSATHKENADIAVFQAKISSLVDPDATLHQRLVALGSKARARVFERVHGPLGILVSAGHNQLLRLDALRAVGGFDERFSAEDTALSLSLRACGWRIALIDTWTFDTEPSTFEAYARRTVRWARQTAQLFRATWPDSPLRLRLLLCRHLISYVVPIGSVFLLTLSAFMNALSISDAARFVRLSVTLEPGFEPFGYAMWAGTCAMLADIGARFLLLWCEREPRGLWFLSVLWGIAASMALSVPLALAIIREPFSRALPFVPTNSRTELVIDMERRLRRVAVTSSCVVLACVTVATVRSPGILVLGWNIVWLSAAALAPWLPVLGTCRMRNKRNS
jgi:hypothetical protein